MDDIIYIALVLSDASQEIVKSIDPLKLQKVYCHHMTVAFGRDITEEHLKMLGRRVTVETGVVVGDEDCCAVSVSGCASANAHPHITLSTREGVPPVRSNDLFADVAKVLSECHVVLDGTIMAFCKGGTWKTNVQHSAE